MLRKRSRGDSTSPFEGLGGVAAVTVMPSESGLERGTKHSFYGRGRAGELKAATKDVAKSLAAPRDLSYTCAYRR